jgi:hypothetical protein
MEKPNDAQVLALLLIELIEQRGYLIMQLATTYDSDEMNKLTGRLHQLQFTIDKIRELRKG